MTPDPARIRVLAVDDHPLARRRGKIVYVGDPGSGCSSDQYRQFNTAAVTGPQYGMQLQIRFGF